MAQTHDGPGSDTGTTSVTPYVTDSPYTASIIAELLHPPPRPLQTCDAELLFIGDGYIFHSRDDTTHSYRSLSAEGVRTAFAAEPTDSDWLPPNILRTGANTHGSWFIGLIPAGPHTITLTADHGEPEKQLSVPLPPLIFVGAQQNYAVWATTDTAISPTSELYHAPLPNVYPNGTICWGGNSIPSVSPQAFPIVWSLFLSAPFSHPNGGIRSRKHGQDPRPLLRRLDKSRKKVYPLDDLVPTTKPLTVAAILRDVIDPR